VNELHIPEASIRALMESPTGGFDSWAHVDATIRAIAAPVVAAELRRLADTWGDSRGNPIAFVPPEYVAQILRARADELDPS
jgi:hypothetical protein